MLTLALAKGRIFEKTLPLLERAGITVYDSTADHRRLILPTSNDRLRVLIVRASDVPAYVEYGGADFGVAGQDVLIEYGDQGLYCPVNLHIARCRLSIAVRRGFDYESAVAERRRLRIASKYLRSARTYFSKKGLPIDCIKMYGSMELAPIVGLADGIVDLVSSGETLRANDLVEVEKILDISSWLVVNKSSFKLKRSELLPLIQNIRVAVNEVKKIIDVK